MNRDMDLARQILLAVEEQGGAHAGDFVAITFPDRTANEVSYHVELLHEAGLVIAVNLSTMNTTEWRPVRLTWSGHEFIESARNDTIWNKAKEVVVQKSGGLSFEVLKFALIETIKGVLV